LLERSRFVLTDYLTELLLTGCAKQVGVLHSTAAGYRVLNSFFNLNRYFAILNLQ